MTWSIEIADKDLLNHKNKAITSNICQVKDNYTFYTEKNQWMADERQENETYREMSKWINRTRKSSTFKPGKILRV